jgi:DNA-binding transcriptional regulator YiaG
MANIGTVLKTEMARVARKEARGQNGALQKASTRHRAEIAGLKRRIAVLEQTLARLLKQSGRRPVASETVSVEEKQRRFSPKTLRSHRKRLGLSVEDMGRLLEVSGPTIYNYERGVTRPDPRRVDAIARLRGMKKEDIRAMLGQAIESPISEGKAGS